MKGNTKKLVLMAMFIALSFVGSYIKIPSPLGTIAFDSTAGYLSGLILGGITGGTIGFLGHILTSASIGFPLSLPVHLIVAIMMFISVYLYGFVYKKTNIFIGAFVGILLNGIVSPLILLIFPQFGWPFFLGIAPFLLIGSTLNVILSALVFIPLKNTLFNKQRS
ncbi:ECF transporter S component [Maledivibacter halophilus]|uniref:Alpha-ribazole transporter n=1 Tax=Maledivibacter halophilus TaxID=36842 RepID=A0A1T5M0A5_9FIRM|nr:ECF transporter S component [Maledivibacter halophilus]SKC81647.1 alpha-ribazole transporter [Maledivibacter halophilus]